MSRARTSSFNPCPDREIGALLLLLLDSDGLNALKCALQLIDDMINRILRGAEKSGHTAILP